MAKYNEILSGRYNRALQKLFSMKGEPPSPQLAGEIAMTLAMFYGAENRYLEGWQRYAMTRGNVAVAAQVGQVQIRNPLSSGSIAVIERMTMSGTLLDQCFFLLQKTNADLTTVFSQTAGVGRLDGRGPQNSSMIFSSQTGVLPTLANYQGNFPANSFFDFIATDIHEIPLVPGDAIQMFSNTANQAMTTSWMWRERSLEDSEKS